MNEIIKLKSNLAKTNHFVYQYKTKKITEQEYLEIKQQRQEWFERLNELKRQGINDGENGNAN